MATLVVDTTTGPVAIQIRGACIVGRDEACAVRIDHPTLSRRHARLSPSDNGWTIEDLGSQNGCRMEGKRIEGTTALHDGAQLRLGRIRAWFFEHQAPIGWTPDSLGGAGKSVEGNTASCPHCGATAWAPSHASGLQLTCRSCGKRLTIEAPKPKSLGECAACHSEIIAGEATHTCPNCHAVHHEDCWTDNHGCATYGCGAAVAADVHEPLDAPPVELDVADSIVSPVEIAGVTLTGLAGLISFGVPSFAAGGWLLMKRRMLAGGIALLLGVAGVVVSGVWWLGWLR
jgi:predicted RNA-binding Zn-ribbon protein involved in translation (DUF1610 family)